MRLGSLLILWLLISGCKPTQIVRYERDTRDSVVIREVLKPVNVPGFSLKGPTVHPDSVRAWIAAGVQPEIIRERLFVQDPETLARVGFLMDELGNLTALCEQQDRIIEALVREKETYRFEFERVVEQEKATLMSYFRSMALYLGGILAALGFLLLMLIFLRKK